MVYAGTFSKTLFPSLRIGFMVMPPALAQVAGPAISSLLRGGHRGEQLTLARFIEDGHYARHLAAMRRLYRKRQGEFAGGAASRDDGSTSRLWRRRGNAFNVVDPGIDDVVVVREARKAQLAPHALSRFWLQPDAASSGLVLGYGNTSASQFTAAVRTLNHWLYNSRAGEGEHVVKRELAFALHHLP